MRRIDSSGSRPSPGAVPYRPRRRSLPAARRARAGAAAALLPFAAIASLFLAAFAYWPRRGADVERAPGVHVLVVDASASVRRLRSDWTRWARARLRAEALRAERDGRELALITFAADVRRVLGPAPPRTLLDRLAGRDGAPLRPAEGAGADHGSRLVAALQAAESLVLSPEREPGVVVLVGPGSATDGDPNPALARLARGARVERVEPPAPERADLGLLGLQLPRTLEAGAPLDATVTVRYKPAAAGAATPRGTLELELVEAGVRRLVRVGLELEGWDGTRRLSVPLGPAAEGLTRVDAQVRLVEGVDPIPENDAASASTSTSASRVLGVVRPDGVAVPPGAPDGIERVDLAVAELPELFDDLDAVLAVDVSIEQLQERVPGEVLQRFVRDGGGWVSTAGWSFLGGWTRAAAEAGLGALLPLEPAPSAQGPRDVVLLLDGSQSMEGAPFEAVREAAVALVAAAAPSDRVMLHFFTVVLQPEVLLKERDAREEGREAGVAAARRLLSSTVPRGATHLLASLEQFVERRPAGAAPALVLLLTDGREMQTAVVPHEERGAELRQRLLDARVRLVPLAVGERVELDVLRSLVPEGQPVRHVRDLEDLDGLFRREVGAAQTVAAPPDGSLALALAGAPQGLARGALEGAAAPPPVQRFVRARPRPQADVAWVDEEYRPLLALARVDRGRVALLTTALNRGWAPAWLEPAGREPWGLLGPLLRWAARRAPGSGGAKPRARVEGERVLVEGLPGSLAPLLRAELVRGSAAVELELRAPARAAAAPSGGAAERVGRLAPSERARLLDGAPAGAATLLVDAAESGGPDPGTRLALPLALGPAPEFLGGGVPLDPDLFAAEGASGRPPAGDAPRAERAHPAAPWLAGLGLLLASLWAYLGLRPRGDELARTSRIGRQGGTSFGR